MDYEQLKLKRFEQWDLYLHKNQFPYVGRAYAWALREDANHIRDMNSEERDELFSIIIPSWEKSVSGLFIPDRINLAILGNEAPHLHAHLIPRYNTPRAIHNIEFIDPSPTGNYAPYPKKDIPLEILLQLKEDIVKRL
jgi:diadenosine tetraphosphate (Ap4A) HIT family hydrolase